MNQRCCMPKQKKWDDCKCRDHEEHECRRCGDEPGKAILKCTNGFSVSNLVTVALPIGSIAPVPLGSLSINTDRLCNPTTLFTFSGRISAILAITLNALSFRVTKTCNGISQVIGSFDVTPSLGAPLSDSFSFQVCDCNPSCCCGCVTYSLEFITSAAIDVTVGLTINNVVLSVLAVGKEEKDNDKDRY